MKLYFGLFIISIIVMFYGLYTNNINLILTFGFIGVSSSIFSTSIGKEQLMKEIFEKIKK